MKRAAALVLLLASCGREPGPRERALHELAYGVILPNYRAFSEAAERLARAAEARPADPETLRRAWRDARDAWARCGAHVIGPEHDRLLDAKIDTWPAEPPVEAGDVERLGAHRKGFFAIEALLFDDPGGRPDVLAALARDLARVASEIRDVWEDAGGGFARAFSRAGTPGSPFASRQAAFDLLINHLVVFAEHTNDLLARPAGLTVASEGRRDASLLRAARSDHDLDDLRSAVESLRRVYAGGLAGPVAQASPEMDAAIRGALDVAPARLSEIPRPLRSALDGPPEPLRRAVAALRGLKVRIAVDLVSAYRTTLTVSPFDGD